MGDTDELLRSLEAWSPDLLVARRLTVLTALVAYWHGERLREPRPVNANLPLPPALGWLYSEIAARNPRPFRPFGPGWVEGAPVMIFNSPRDPPRFEADESGNITFLIEQQGVFRCGTPADASDGPVFRQEMHGTTWRRCADRLSDFLLWEVVFELLACGRDGLWGLFPPGVAAEITGRMVKVNTGDVSTYGAHHQVYHSNDLVMISTPSGAEICLEAVARTGQPLKVLQEVGGWNER